MIRILTATEPNAITITLDDPLAGEYVEARHLRDTGDWQRETVHLSRVALPPWTRAAVGSLGAWLRRAFHLSKCSYTIAGDTLLRAIWARLVSADDFGTCPINSADACNCLKVR